MKGQLSAPVAAAIFALGTSILILAAILKVESVALSRHLAPLPPAAEAGARWIHVLNCSGTLIAVDAGTPNASQAEELVGLSCRDLASFELWPGGYSCNGTARIGPDPFTGLWCPPPKMPDGKCSSGVLVSEGRFLLVQC